MDVVDREFSKTIVWPAIRTVTRASFATIPGNRRLESLGVQEQNLAELVSEILNLLGSYGWTMNPEALSAIGLDTPVAFVTTTVARYAALLGGPKKCPNGHPQQFPGQRVCSVDHLPFK